MTDSFELTIDSLAHGGAGVGRHEGRAIFVPSVIPGERVRAVITQDKGRYARARLVEIVSPSPLRVAPVCDHFGVAGSCVWQHIAIEQQAIYKREIVIDQLRRVGQFSDPTVLPTIAGSQAWGYRHSMIFHSAPDGQLGLWNEDHSQIVLVESCALLHPALVDLIDQLDLSAPEIKRVRFVMGNDPEDRMIVIETHDDLAPEIEVDIPVSVNLLLSDHEPVNLIGSPQVKYTVGERQFQVTAGAFYHPNAGMVPMLVDHVLQRLALGGDESILELYSGVGTLTAFLAEQADMVLSVESYPPAVTDAEVNTDGLDNVELVEGSVEEVLDDLVGPFDKVVVDPPPAGLSAEVVDGLARLNPPQIVYVSADPAALARDAQRLTRQGYTLAEVQPFDMEPQTPLIVCVAVLVQT